VPGPAARLIRAAIEAAGAVAAGGRDRVIAVGWATVDLDRTIWALSVELDVAPEAFVMADDSQAVGGTGRVAPGILAGGRSLAILEPFREGALAGALARWDEGPRIVWIEPDDGSAAQTGVAVSGPFGPERLVAGQASDGLLRLVVPSPGTIRS
jgi:hypothetical protein